MMLADVDRQASGWKVRAVVHGFDGGLAPLSRHFGVVIDNAPAVPAPAPPVQLGKVILDKPSQSATINLGKEHDGTIEHVAVRFDWTHPIDLDLQYELDAITLSLNTRPSKTQPTFSLSRDW